ncbi:probable aquaporin SIP2-1 isoform X2 [Macadamia integrifolia]|uniref:probable aquaporin SIP2-1 isoform X2 n=1 Tax=Macadamia integrifolia TaxID=60698 RepID=UPI001C4FA6F7|nr:probable aquaporin SIP2-1 isoform X2 [Macadamia integrifolia]
MACMRLILSDFILSFMWVWSGALIKFFVYNILGFGFETKGEILKASLSILSMLFFAWLCKISSGGSYNPLTVLSGAISGNFTGFLFTVGARIPAQVLGSISGVKYIIDTFPGIGHGPRLNVDIHRGALTEGLLTFAIVIISLGLARSNPSSFFIRAWVSSVSKLTLHILGSDLTGHGMGLCPWRSYNQRAYICILACTN